MALSSEGSIHAESCIVSRSGFDFFFLNINRRPGGGELAWTEFGQPIVSRCCKCLQQQLLKFDVMKFASTGIESVIIARFGAPNENTRFPNISLINLLYVHMDLHSAASV